MSKIEEVTSLRMLTADDARKVMPYATEKLASIETIKRVKIITYWTKTSTRKVIVHKVTSDRWAILTEMSVTNPVVPDHTRKMSCHDIVSECGNQFHLVPDLFGPAVEGRPMSGGWKQDELNSYLRNLPVT